MLTSHPRLSGLDLARGLIRARYRMTASISGYLLLERDTRAVTIPLLDELPDPLLRFLVLAAGVSLPQMTTLLNDPSGIAAPKPSSIPPRATIRSSRPLETLPSHEEPRLTSLRG
jgi:hypothetical protein